MRVGVLGVGNIGSIILKGLASGDLGPYEVVLAADIKEDPTSKSLADALGIRFEANPMRLLEADLDLVVEAASQEAVRVWAPRILEKGISIVILSVGALSEGETYSRIVNSCKMGGANVYVPSGAVGGLDVLKGASIGRITSVTLITRKPLESLRGIEMPDGKDVNSLKEPNVIFHGSAREAGSMFPLNLNVAVTVGLAGIGIDATRVKLIADPHVRHISHRIEAKGEFGSVEVEVKNLPSPHNPRTSHLAALSALALLKELHQKLRVGT